jgi:dimeric dUTPase (all-alpha-NTP-PPase superfamily)
MNYIKRMAEKQDSLNEVMVKGWRSKGLGFRVALWIEAAEAMESTSWKWWKSGGLDTENIIVESVDMMHFALSICLQEGYEGWNWLDVEITDRFNKEIIIPDDKFDIEVQTIIESIARESFADSLASWGPHDLILRIVDLMRTLGLDRDDMLRFYMAKSVLNEFRQDNGYKDGTYPKVWFGEEDNVCMLKEARAIEVSDDFPELLYSRLGDVLREVKHGKENHTEE